MTDMMELGPDIEGKDYRSVCLVNTTAEEVQAKHVEFTDWLKEHKVPCIVVTVRDFNDTKIDADTTILGDPGHASVLLMNVAEQIAEIQKARA